MVKIKRHSPVPWPFVHILWINSEGSRQGGVVPLSPLHFEAPFFHRLRLENPPEQVPQDSQAELRPHSPQVQSLGAGTPPSILPIRYSSPRYGGAIWGSERRPDGGRRGEQEIERATIGFAAGGTETEISSRIRDLTTQQLCKIEITLH